MGHAHSRRGHGRHQQLSTDARVTISQGYELYNALKRQNVQTKMIVYPRQPHGIREPKLALQSMHHNLEWVDKHLRADESESD